MPGETYIDHRLINRIQSVERGACGGGGSDAEEKLAQRCIELTRLRDGLTVRIELPSGQRAIYFDDH